MEQKMKKEVAILMVISLITGFLIGYGYMSMLCNKNYKRGEI